MPKIPTVSSPPLRRGTPSPNPTLRGYGISILGAAGGASVLRDIRVVSDFS